MEDQVVHAFDEEHFAVAVERQKMYPEHRRCPPPHYDWARGSVCGCGTPLLGSNPPVGGKGEQMGKTNDFVEEFIHDLDAAGTCRVPWCHSTSDNEKDHISYKEIMDQVKGIGRDDHLLRPGLSPSKAHECETQDCPQEAEPVKPVVIKMGPGKLHFQGQEFPFENMRLSAVIPDTDDEHLIAAGVFPVEEGHNVHLSIDTGFMMMPETNACEYIFGVHGWKGMLQVWVRHFLSKQADYGDRANDLGLAGQYAELSRKFIKLRRAMWEGHELTQESLKEVLLDLIGHGFLSLMYVENPHFTVYPKGTVK